MIPHNRILIILVLGLTYVGRCQPSCHIYMRTSSKPYFYWYAEKLGHSRMKLSEDMKTLWSAEQPPGTKRLFTFQVQNNSLQESIGQYLCVHRPSHIHLCDSSISPSWIKFDTMRNGLEFIMRAVAVGLKGFLYAHKKNGDWKIHLAEEDTVPGAKWHAEIVHGCEDVFTDVVAPCRIKNGGCNQNCSHEGPVVSCSCLPGFELGGDNKTCNKVDLCKIKNGGCDQKCSHEGIAVLCSCDIGFELGFDDKTCDKVAPCKIKNGGCNQNCSHEGPVVLCSCLPGFELGGDNKTCNKVDPCKKDNGGCSQRCSSEGQKVLCSCNYGFDLDKSDNKTCTEVNPCKTDNGGCDQLCFPEGEAALCSCNAGFHLLWDNKSCGPAILENTAPPLNIFDRTTTAEDGTYPTEPICVDENLMPLVGLSPCIPAGSEDDIKNILKNAVQSMNETLSRLGDIDATQDNDTYGSSPDAVILQFAERVEKLGLQIATRLLVNQTISVNTEGIEMTASNQALPFIFRKTNSDNGITVEGGEELDTYPVVGISYENLHTYISGNLVLENGSGPYRLHSQFISASVGNDATIDNVEVVLFHLTEVEDNNKTVCAFWNNTGKQHFWSTAGCYKVESESFANFTTCHCTHLTNFALLTAVRQFEISKLDKKVLDMLSLVCCSVSIVFLAIGIILFMILLCGERKHTRYIIHVNLMIALFIAQVVFLTGINAVGNKILCKCIAFVLHYFLLASFTWMFVEGVYLYFAMIKVYSKGKDYLRSYMGLAWGVPVLIVGITGAIRHHWYGTDKYCWLSNEGHTIWAFLGPVVAIISVNAVILLVVIRQVFLLSRYDKIVQDVKVGLRSSLILLPILGVTWVFGMLSVNSETVVFQYIFSITNSLQGFMITLFHCFLNTEVRKALKRKFEVWMHSTAVGKVFQSTRQKVNTGIDLSLSSTVSSSKKRRASRN